MPNPWDVGSARLLAGAGFEALATTSAGFAWSQGRDDYGVTRDELVEHVRPDRCGDRAAAQRRQRTMLRRRSRRRRRDRPTAPRRGCRRVFDRGLERSGRPDRPDRRRHRTGRCGGRGRRRRRRSAPAHRPRREPPPRRRRSRRHDRPPDRLRRCRRRLRLRTRAGDGGTDPQRSSTRYRYRSTCWRYRAGRRSPRSGRPAAGGCRSVARSRARPTAP